MMPVTLTPLTARLPEVRNLTTPVPVAGACAPTLVAPSAIPAPGDSVSVASFSQASPGQAGPVATPRPTDLASLLKAGYETIGRVDAKGSIEAAPPASAADALPPPPPDAATDHTRRLSTNPLFAAGVNADEFQVTAQNLEFAREQFKLEPGWCDLVKVGSGKAHFSVVYHTEADGIRVDAYRVAADAGKKSVFTAYDVKNPGFDPARAYNSELMTPLGNGRFFGTCVVSKELAVPETAPASLTEFLAQNGYVKKSSVEFGTLGHSQAFKDYFGLPDKLGIDMYDLQTASFSEKFKVFYKLFKEEPEYRLLKIGDMLGDIGSAALLGVITPKLWEQGTAYGIASTISSIGNIGGPSIGILGESLLGSVVDNAVNSDKPLENLKKVSLWTGGLQTAKAGCYFAMHPAIIAALGPHPGAAFVGLYATSILAGGISGVMSGKADFAIHDQLINKSGIQDKSYSKNFYQILGVESSISQALYLGSYTATVAAVAAFPGVSVPIAAGGAALWGASNFMWAVYHEKPEVKTTIEGTAFIHEGNRYIFDSGWEVSFKGQEGKIVQEDATHFSVSFDDGELYIKNDHDKPVDVEHKRRFKDYLPKFLKPKILGEKERWDLTDGDQEGDRITVARFGNSGYQVKKLSDKEFVVTRTDQPEPYWDGD